MLETGRAEGGERDSTIRCRCLSSAAPSLGMLPSPRGKYVALISLFLLSEALPDPAWLAFDEARLLLGSVKQKRLLWMNILALSVNMPEVQGFGYQ